MARPKNVLVIASYVKGQRFMSRLAKHGAKAWLLTREKHLKADWPRDALQDVLAVSGDAQLPQIINAVSYLGRKIDFDAIVPMDDYDVELGAALREHLRLPGMNESTARHFRDKLAMRVRAREAGIRIPDFVHAMNHDRIRDFCRRNPAPWMLKPRWEASASGISKLHDEKAVFKKLDEKGDKASFMLLESYVAGDVFHVDSILVGGKVLFAEAHKCGKPPFDVAHGGGLYSSTTVERGSSDETKLRTANEAVLKAFGHDTGVSHAEFIKDAGGEFQLLECAARVGGAHTAELVEGATGINLWEAWADVEFLGADYVLPERRFDHGGLLMTLSKVKHPDLSSYDAKEVWYRAPDEFHAGLALHSPDHARASALVAEYTARMLKEFNVVLPPAERPTH